MRPPYGATNAYINDWMKREFGMKVILCGSAGSDWFRPPMILSLAGWDKHPSDGAKVGDLMVRLRFLLAGNCCSRPSLAQSPALRNVHLALDTLEVSEQSARG